MGGEQALSIPRSHGLIREKVGVILPANPLLRELVGLKDRLAVIAEDSAGERLNELVPILGALLDEIEMLGHDAGGPFPETLGGNGVALSGGLDDLLRSGGRPAASDNL